MAPVIWYSTEQSLQQQDINKEENQYYERQNWSALKTQPQAFNYVRHLNMFKFNIEKEDLRQKTNISHNVGCTNRLS
jgi:hypothetical protein